MSLARTAGAAEWLSDLACERVFSVQTSQRNQRANHCSQAGNTLSCIQGGLPREPAVVRAADMKLPDFWLPLPCLKTHDQEGGQQCLQYTSFCSDKSQCQGSFGDITDFKRSPFTSVLDQVTLQILWRLRVKRRAGPALRRSSCLKTNQKYSL